MLRFIATLLGAGFLGLGCIPSALADTLASRANNWTGFYVGGNIGYGWATARNDFAFAQSLFLGGNAVLAGTDSNRINGVIGGGQFGYNWQVDNYLLGIEADLQASGEKKSTVLNSAITSLVGFTPGVNPTSISYSNKLEWFSTLRGRIGFISGPWLMYGTGGIAIGTLSTAGVINPTSTIFVTNLPGTWDQSSTKVGWTIGAGIENAITSNWSWKFEYLYLNLGSVNSAATLPASNCYSSPGGCANANAPGVASISSKFTDNIVRIGLNYKLGN